MHDRAGSLCMIASRPTLPVCLAPLIFVTFRTWHLPPAEMPTPEVAFRSEGPGVSLGSGVVDTRVASVRMYTALKL